ncbi:hypothetical protein M8J77_019183 [Diaphorina citri]|nr:hypothetical protein M8J77_016032 [Diaphorina citri]KAI5747852.1 hypothetical protein M8J77_019183 [Diaphorina citri]
MNLPFPSTPSTSRLPPQLPVYPLNSSSTPSTFVFSSYNGSGPRTLFLSSKFHYDLTVLTSWLCTLGCRKPDIRLLQL